MNDEDRKVLTERLLGECWHEYGMWQPSKKDQGLPYMECLCGCNHIISYWKDAHTNRTFLTPDDMMAVKRKLVEKGLYDRFSVWAQNKLDSIPGPRGNRRRFDDWLIDEKRFCQLACDYLKELEEGKGWNR